MPVIPGLNLNPDFAPQITNEETGEVVPLIDYYAHEPLDPLRISVPTKGVFAEAIMGKCNSCENKEEQRFWRWEESPIPDSPTAINPVTVPTPAVIEPNLQAAPLSTPVVNIQNAPNAPDPQGLAGILNLLGKGDTFRDTTGLTENQKNALIGLQEAFKGATNFGTMGLELKKANLSHELESKKLDLQSQQMENEKQMRQNKLNKMSALLDNKKIGLKDFTDYLQTEGMSSELKKMIDANNAEKNGDITADQKNQLSSEKPIQEKIDSAKAKSTSLMDAVNKGSMTLSDAQNLTPAIYQDEFGIAPHVMPENNKLLDILKDKYDVNDIELELASAKVKSKPVVQQSASHMSSSTALPLLNLKLEWAADEVHIDEGAILFREEYNQRIKEDRLLDILGYVQRVLPQTAFQDIKSRTITTIDRLAEDLKTAEGRKRASLGILGVVHSAAVKVAEGLKALVSSNRGFGLYVDEERPPVFINSFPQDLTVISH